MATKFFKTRKYASIFFFILACILTGLLCPSASFAAFTSAKVPVSGVDTSDGSFDVARVQINDNVRDAYSAPLSAYNEGLYQEYLFDYSVCNSAQITSVRITINWMVRRASAAKLEVYDHTGAYVNYALSASTGTNGEVTDTITVTNITTWEDVNKLKIRFLAVNGGVSGSGDPAVDYVQVSVEYTDAGVCIHPDNYKYYFSSTTQTVTASHSNIISSGSGTVNLTSTSAHGWTTRKYLDANMDGVKDNNTPITSLTFTGDEFKGIVVEVDIPASNPAFSGSDTTTVTATRAAYSGSAADVTMTPADGIAEAEYFEPYANHKFFNYGPDPNMASGWLHTYVKDDILHVYYAQNPRNINDNTYGTWTQCGWGTCPSGTGGHTLNTDLTVSDKTEFIFYDENGNIKLNFFSDYVSVLTTGTTQYPGGYHSCGFQPCFDGAASDGSMLINNTSFSDAGLAALMSIESSAAYNINRYTPTVNGNTIVNCGAPYGNVDLKLNSPPINRVTYELFCPAASDFQFDYAIELVLPIAKIFPNEPVINIVARAHNSPAKNSLRDNPPTPAIASLGDYVWYDMNANGLQDFGEPGIPNVRVVLYWDKNGDGLFSAGEQILEKRTNSEGYYLFDEIYGGHYFSTREGVEIYAGDYKVYVDETTVTPGFVRSLTPNPYVLSDLVAGACSLTQYGTQPACTGAGGTWTPKSRGTLAYDEDCRSADFGYKPLGGVIGDFVWFDQDQDGIQDNWELGLEGVTLDLYCVSLDTPDPSITCPGVIESAQTNSQGKYFFTGASIGLTDGLPAGTYRVDVRDENFLSGGALAGYTHTTGPESHDDPTEDIILPVNGVHLYADFGYYTDVPCARGDISGKVFFDQDWSGVFDGVDTALSNVDISIWKDVNNNELLDSGDSFLGSAKTNTNGDYHFYGVPASASGIKYILQVTSSVPGLDKFYPGGGLIATLTNLSPPGSCISAQNFPYVGAGVIGDFVWNDLNNNGIQDAGEPGIEGVTVQAESCTTISGNCVVGFTYIFTTTPDSQGRYIFSGLRTTKEDGSGTRYRVTVTDTGGVLTGWNQSPRPCTGSCTTANDSDDPAGTYVILGGGNPFNDTTIDFGYHNPTMVFGSIGDYIWNDEVPDGLQNEAADHGLDNVTVELRDGSGNTLASTTTSGGGYYSFQGLTVSGSGIVYQVVVTDLNNVLNGFILTTDPQVMTVTLTTSNPNVLTADAGYWQPTLAVVSSFRAFSEGGRVTVEWKTVAERDTVGFYLYRLNERTGKFEKVKQELLPGLLTSPAGGTYRLIDESAAPFGKHVYKLVEVERKGGSINHGPFPVELGGESALISKRFASDGALVITIMGDAAAVRAASSAQEAGFEKVTNSFSRKARETSRTMTERLAAAQTAKEKKKLARKSLTGSAVKITVAEDGIYYLEASDISALLGTSVESVKEMIKNGLLALSYRGEQAAYTPAKDNAGILFFGAAADSVYTNENVYWLKAEKGLLMEQDRGGKGQLPREMKDYFTDTLHIEKDLMPAENLAGDPNSDYWYWDYVMSGIPGFDGKEFGFNAYSVSGSPYTATVTVRLQGLSESDSDFDYHASISLNGLTLGEWRWDGSYPYTIAADTDQSLIREGENVLGVGGILDAEVPYSIFLVDSFDVSYARRYEAASDYLRFRAEGNTRMSVTGFSAPDISVFDITDPLKPKLVTSAVVEGQAGKYAVRFNPGNLDASYIAVASAATVKAEAVADLPSDLKGRDNSADYIVIAPEELKEAAALLADYRRSKGLTVKVVSLEDIMDEFNYGMFDPSAIRGFLDYSYRYWKKRPLYAALVGEGNFDYKNAMGLGGNLLPPLMVGTPMGLMPSDNILADLNGDNVPEIAVGRLPVLSAAELSAVVDKIRSFEGYRSDGVIMLADKADGAGNFPKDSDDISAIFAASRPVQKIYLSADPLEQARTLLFEGLGRGVQFVNYLGHASIERLSEGGLLTGDDVAGLNNGVYPVMTAMTCSAGHYAIPGFDSLMSLLLVKSGGGIVSSWAPSGWSYNTDAKMLGEGFYKAAFQPGAVTLGNAVFKSMLAHRRAGRPAFMLNIFNILGDPALRIK